MADGLQLCWQDYMHTVAEYLGWRTDASLWTSEQADKLLRIVNAGYHQFLYPEPQKTGPVHWSFLKVQGQITTLATITGTCTSGTTLSLTKTGAAFPTLTGADIQITRGGVVSMRRIVSNTTDTVTWAATGAGGGAVAGITYGDAYSIGQVDYPMPADFGSICGRLYYSPDSAFWLPLPVVAPQQIYECRSVWRMTIGVPLYAAVTVNPGTGASGQTHSLMLWPYPTTSYFLRFLYNAVYIPLSASYPYPLAGAGMSDTIRASCMDVAERDVFGEEAEQHANYARRMAAAVALDNEQSPGSLGEMRDDFDPRTDKWNRYNRNWHSWSGSFSVNGSPV